jgi:hypothetical protein
MGLYDFDKEPEPVKSIEEYGERRKACMGGVLKDGEQRIWMSPAFKLTDPNPSKNYGISGVDIHFAERRGDIVVDTRFLTDMYLEWEKPMPRYRDKPMYPMCTGLYTHHKEKPADEDDYYYENEECNLTEAGKCWGEMGSALYGEYIGRRLVAEGSAAVWDEIDKQFKSLEGGDDEAKEVT